MIVPEAEASSPLQIPTKLLLFVAVEDPGAHRESEAQATAPLRKQLAEARWTSPESQHGTLKFLGPTEADRLGEVKDLIASVAERHAPSPTKLSSLGAFPSRSRARVLWLGLEDPAGLLTSLAADLESSFEPLGWQPERRSFTPHLTLARFKTPQRLPELPELTGLELESFEVDKIVLYQSRLHPKGARYEPLTDFALARRESS